MEKPKRTKAEIRRSVKNVLLIIAGCALLAFGDAAFIAPLNLVTGGVLSVGVIAQHFFDLAHINFNIVDIATWIMQIILLIVSFIFLGKKFTLRTLFATLLYPALLSLFMRIPVGGASSVGELVSRQLTKEVITNATMENGQLIVATGENYALTLLGGIVGGAFVGAGVGVTYHGGGSTGGLDVISVIIAKYTSVKEALSAFIMDGSLVIIGIFCTRDLPHGFIAMISALACALAVQFIFVNMNGFVIADIISSHQEEIRAYVEKEMDRTTTIISARGGYSGQDKPIMRVCLSKRELYRFKEFIGQVDPRAFVTFTQAAAINGEGFDPLVAPKTISELVASKQTNPSEGTQDNGR